MERPSVNDDARMPAGIATGHRYLNRGEFGWVGEETEDLRRRSIAECRPRRTSKYRCGLARERRDRGAEQIHASMQTPHPAVSELGSDLPTRHPELE
jgi:hypothetical protein